MYIALGLALVGFFAAVVGGIMIIISAFKKSILWGLGVLFVPFAGLVFVVLNWEETKKAFLINIGGCALAFLAAVMAPGLVGNLRSSRDTGEIAPQGSEAYPTPGFAASYELTPSPTPLFQEEQPPIGLPESSNLSMAVPTPTQPSSHFGESDEDFNLSAASTLAKQAGHRVQLFFKNGKRSYVNVVGPGLRGVKVTERVGAGEMTYEVRLDTLEGYRLIR